MSIVDDLSAYRVIRDGLLVQGVQALSDMGDCRYRGGTWEQDGPDFHDKEYVPDGKKCAVGFVLADEHYDTRFEDHVISGDISLRDAVRSSNPEWDMNQESYDFLSGMQHIHDQLPVEDWQIVFDEIDRRIVRGDKLPDEQRVISIHRIVTKRDVLEEKV